MCVLPTDVKLTKFPKCFQEIRATDEEMLPASLRLAPSLPSRLDHSSLAAAGT